MQKVRTSVGNGPSCMPIPEILYVSKTVISLNFFKQAKTSVLHVCPIEYENEIILQLMRSWYGNYLKFLQVLQTRGTYVSKYPVSMR
jgi:hypothetical protein